MNDVLGRNEKKLGPNEISLGLELLSFKSGRRIWKHFGSHPTSRFFHAIDLRMEENEYSNSIYQNFAEGLGFDIGPIPIP